MKTRSTILTGAFLFVFSLGGWVFADCPSADLTGDCFVDFEDFAVMANQWLTGCPNVPDDMVYIPGGWFEMGDHHRDGDSDELPVHVVLLDAFFMSKFETTNQQYCDYLNSALEGGTIFLIANSVYGSVNNQLYCHTSASNPFSQITYNGGGFSVGTKDGRDMSNDPVVVVTWYASAAYCNWRSAQEGYQQLYDPCDPNWPCDFNKNGYRLATEAEWEYAARGGQNSPYYRFPWGDTISHSQANYFSYWEGYSPYYSYDVSPTEGYHPLWNGVDPDTSPVGFFDGTMKYKADYNWPGSDTSYQTTSGANGYGLYDMTGNLLEWCNDWFETDYYSASPHDNPTGPASSSFGYRVLRDGAWPTYADICRVAGRAHNLPGNVGSHYGFRVVLDLE